MSRDRALVTARILSRHHAPPVTAIGVVGRTASTSAAPASTATITTTAATSAAYPFGILHGRGRSIIDSVTAGHSRGKQDKAQHDDQRMAGHDRTAAGTGDQFRHDCTAAGANDRTTTWPSRPYAAATAAAPLPPVRYSAAVRPSAAALGHGHPRRDCWRHQIAEPARRISRLRTHAQPANDHQPPPAHHHPRRAPAQVIHRRDRHGTPIHAKRFSAPG